MDKGTTGRDTFDWRLPLYGAASALIVFAPMMFDDSHLLGTLYFFVAAPIISVFLLVEAIRKKGRGRLAALSMVVAYSATSWGLFRNSLEIRGAARWLLWSKDYKTEVLAQPNLANGSLKHIEWDGWGFAGANTVEYLVFDPNDSLWIASRSHSSGKFSGLPCEVFHVRRLQRHYYSVLFYTGTDWAHCN
jgi:hypothetical protein